MALEQKSADHQSHQGSSSVKRYHGYPSILDQSGGPTDRRRPPYSHTASMTLEDFAV